MADDIDALEVPPLDKVDPQPVPNRGYVIVPPQKRPKVKDKLWFVRLNEQGTYEPVQGTVVKVDAATTLPLGPTEDHYWLRYQFRSTVGGELNVTVSDFRITELYTNRKDALIVAAKRCRDNVSKWLARHDALIDQLLAGK